jgi:DNA (cytosine-5)-methyltransferase 1
MKDRLSFGSLFAGIGGFDLGFERAGMVCRWQVEIDDYANRVLAKHWPDVRRERDVREVGRHNLEPVDVICGGFPCTDISRAAGIKQSYLDGARSGLWYEYARIIRALRPSVVVIENSPDVAIRGLDRILCDLAGSGYDAEWFTLSACAVGAAHMRKRMFVCAYPVRERREGWFTQPSWERQNESIPTLEHTNAWLHIPRPRGFSSLHGFPSLVDEIRGLGNAVVPQVAEWIGRRIVEGMQ